MLRRFTDADGVTWNVWDVSSGIYIGSMPPTTFTGQQVTPATWLCFAADNKRKRLAPIPNDWATADDSKLLDYCKEAQPVRPRIASS